MNSPISLPEELLNDLCFVVGTDQLQLVAKQLLLLPEKNRAAYEILDRILSAMSIKSEVDKQDDHIILTQLAHDCISQFWDIASNGVRGSWYDELNFAAAIDGLSACYVFAQRYVHGNTEYRFRESNSGKENDQELIDLLADKRYYTKMRHVKSKSSRSDNPTLYISSDRQGYFCQDVARQAKTQFTVKRLCTRRNGIKFETLKYVCSLKCFGNTESKLADSKGFPEPYLKFTPDDYWFYEDHTLVNLTAKISNTLFQTRKIDGDFDETKRIVLDAVKTVYPKYHHLPPHIRTTVMDIGVRCLIGYIMLTSSNGSNSMPDGSTFNLYSHSLELLLSVVASKFMELLSGFLDPLDVITSLLQQKGDRQYAAVFELFITFALVQDYSFLPIKNLNARPFTPWISPEYRDPLTPDELNEISAHDILKEKCETLLEKTGDFTETSSALPVSLQGLKPIGKRPTQFDAIFCPPVPMDRRQANQQFKSLVARDQYSEFIDKGKGDASEFDPTIKLCSAISRLMCIWREKEASPFVFFGSGTPALPKSLLTDLSKQGRNTIYTELYKEVYTALVNGLPLD